MSANKITPALLVGLIMSGCAATSPESRIESSATKMIVPKGAVEENITELDEVLSCVGVQVAVYGKRKFYVGNDVVDNIKDSGVPDSGRIFLQDAFSTLVSKSPDKIVFAGYHSKMQNTATDNVIVENMRAGNLRSKDTPHYMISAAISQYEKDVQKATSDIDIKIFASWFGDSKGVNTSVLGTHLALLDARSGNLKLTGITSKNVIVIKSSDSSAGAMVGSVKVGGVGLNMAMQKKEGVGAALSQLMKVGAIEITGKFYEDDFDYKKCLSRDERKRILDNAPRKKPRK